MGVDRRDARARSFERGAAAYDRFRPNFPDALFDAMERLVGGPLTGRRVLEVGPGTGRATLPLARRGVQVEAVEPSADMIAVLEHTLDLAGLATSVTIRQGTFEDVEEDSGPYDAVVAAQSLHWADPETRWHRLGSLLRGGGLGFLFWNDWSLDPDIHDYDAVRAVYEQHGAGLPADLGQGGRSVSWAEQEIADHPDVKLVEERTFTWPMHLSVEDYLGLLGTTSVYAVAGNEVRERLFDHLTPVLGDEVVFCGSTLLLTIAAA